MAHRESSPQWCRAMVKLREPEAGWALPLRSHIPSSPEHTSQDSARQ